MKVTEVRISPSKGGRVRAFASVVFDDCFVVNDLRVMEGREGQLFVTMPARKVRSGQMRDIAHPLDGATRQMIEDIVLAEYDESRANLAVGGPKGKDNKGKKQQSPIDRLAAKLFSEDYWTA